MPRTIRYDAVAMTLHWLTALFILGLIGTGLVMGNTVQRATVLQYQLFQLHKSLGLTVLMLSLIRVGWRLSRRPPPLPATMADWEKRLSGIVDWLFYLLLLGLPLLGWAAVSASPLNIPTVLYGIVPWPDMPIVGTLTNRRAVAHVLGDVHSDGAWIMIGLIALHVSAALRHHFILRDRVFFRMWPAAARRP
jgi:cytochrome b561